MDTIQKAAQFFQSVLKNVDPRDFLPDVIEWDSEKRELSVYTRTFKLDREQNIYVIGTGKAAPTMAIAIEQILGIHLERGLIIAPPNSDQIPSKIEMLEGSHPLPDYKSKNATDHLISFIENIPEGSLVLNLLSGGTSALLSNPVDGISMNDFQKTYKILLESGANIHEVNCVRKTLSEVKGGRLLSYFKHVTLLDLIISDVPNDEIASIGSGPTTPQEISYHKAFKVLKQYHAWNELPQPVRNHIADKMDHSNTSEPLLTSDNHLTHEQWIVSSAKKVARRAKEMVEEQGFQATLIEPAWSGLVEEFEDVIINKIRETAKENSNTKQALIFFGESTVKVTGNGLGGRNQELALRIAKRLQHFDSSIIFLSAGTDGIDGPTDAAGAVVNQDTYNRAKSRNIDPDEFIENNDSYHFFAQTGGHIKTGPTGNNVMDIQLVFIHA